MLMRASPQRPTWSRDTARFFDEGDAATNQGPGQSPPLNGPRSITPGAAGVRTVRPYGSGTSGVRQLNAAVLFYGCRPARDSFAAVKPGVSKYYAPQFESPADRALRGQAKIKSRLIGNRDPDDWDMPPKPRWMRWGTYDRHVQRFNELWGFVSRRERFWAAGFVSDKG